VPEGPLPRAGDGAERGKASIRLSTYGASLTEGGPLEPPRRAGLIDFRDGRPAFKRVSARRMATGDFRGGA